MSGNSVTESLNNAFHVVPEASHIDTTYTKGEIVIESDDTNFSRAIGSLDSMGVKTLALAYAARNGISNPAMDGIATSAYPINIEGKTFESLTDEQGQPLHPTHRLMQPYRYRVAVPVRSRLT